MATTEMNCLGGSGGGINPSIFDTVSYMTASSSSATFTIDLTKKYIVVISANYTGNNEFMDIYYVENGTATYLHDSSNVGSSINITGNSMQLSNGSAVASMSYGIIQLD